MWTREPCSQGVTPHCVVRSSSTDSDTMCTKSRVPIHTARQGREGMVSGESPEAEFLNSFPADTETKGIPEKRTHWVAAASRGEQTNVSPGLPFNALHCFLLPGETPGEIWGLQDPKLCSQHPVCFSGGPSLGDNLLPQGARKP